MGLYSCCLLAGLAVTGCSSMSKSVPQPVKPVTVSASLQSDPYPDMRQLTPEQEAQMQNKRALVSQLGTAGANPAPQAAPVSQQVQNPSKITTGSVPQRPLSEASTQQAIPQQNQTPPPVRTAQLAAQPLPQVHQQQAPAPVSKPKIATKKKSTGYFGWLGTISAKRSRELTPAQKLRASRKLLASQHQEEIDRTHITNDGRGPAGSVPPAQTGRPTQVVQGPPANTPVTRTARPEKTRTALKIGKPARPKRLALKPSRVDTKPVRVAKKPARRRLPRARAVKREPVQVARLGSNTRPITTASVAKPNVNMPSRSRPIRVYFSKDSAQLSPRYAARLRQLASLQKSSGRRVHVRAIAAAGPNGEAHADANALNKLAVSRAKAVATKLWAYGVKSNQMVLQASQEQAVGQGRSTLQAARIRRAEIYIE